MQTTELKNLVISKSDYVLWRECSHNVWMKKWKPKIYYNSPLSEFEKHLIESGNMVEEIARQRFGEGELIEGRGIEEIEKTKKLIESGKGIIYQAAFSDGQLFAAVDVLKISGNTIQIYEVKASNASKLEGEDEESDSDEVVDLNDAKALEKYKRNLYKDPHFYDLSFQVNLIRKLGYTVSSACLVRLNRNYVRQSDLDLSSLFVVEDVMKYVNEALPSVDEEINKMAPFLSSPEEPSGPCCCIYKGRSKHCTTFAYLNPNVPEYGVHDLVRIGNSRKKLCELIDSGIYDISEIPVDFELTPKIKKQVDVHKSGRPDFNIEEIKKELDSLRYPIYFLDYESFNPAIPRFSKFKSYQQIPFQFSLHKIGRPDSTPEHFEFLYTDQKDPSSNFIEALSKVIGTEGSVVVWSGAFEKSHINKPLALRLPEYADVIKNINGRIFDLMVIFSKQMHIHPGFHGRASIKKILPILCPELSYKELDIGNGSEAMNTWNRLVTGAIPESEKSGIEKSMLEYCELDTKAMYLIWRYLDQLVSVRSNSVIDN
jgi:hypothetical protein